MSPSLSRSRHSSSSGISANRNFDIDEESELHEEIIGWETKVTFQEKCIKQKCVQTILVLLQFYLSPYCFLKTS